MFDRKAEYVADARRMTRAIWDNLNALQALQAEWSALDYGTTLGTQDGLESASIGSVVFDSANALRATLASGHATNMAKLL
jgi:hypothetical protein